MKVNFTPPLLVAGLAIALLTQIPARAQTISTVAGGGSSTNVQAVNFGFSYPIFAVQYAPTGDIYVNLNGEGAIWKISSSGVVTLVAGGNGTGEIPDGPVTGTGIFPNLTGLVVDASGNLYITEFSSCKVRKISTSGTISTIAGTGTPGFSGDGGAATAAKLNFPFGLAIDATGNIYVADMFNNRVRKISTGGIITTVAGSATSGSGGDGGAATSAQLNQPEGLAFDGSGNLYIADVNNNKIRKVAGGNISTYAGTGIYGSTGDGGPATSATLSSPATVSFDGSGNLYIMDGNSKVRKVTPGGTISTVAGNGTQGFSGDNGPATSAELQGAFGTLVDASGNLLICDESNQRIRKVTPGGTITTFAGNGGNYIGNNGPATSAVLTLPDAVYTDHAGNMYFPDKNTVLRVDAVTGTITTFAGTGGTYSATDGYPAISQPVWSPFGVWGDQAGNIYIGCSGDYTVRKVAPSGIMTKFAGIAGTNGYTGDGGPAVNAAIGHPQGITGDPAGNIYVTDFDHAVVRKITPAGVISTFAGTGVAGFSGYNIPATSAQLGAPNSICSDAAGNIYFGDDYVNSVRKVDLSGIITTVAGGSPTILDAGDNGPATSAFFGDIEGLTCDAIGNLYIVDGHFNRVRRVDAATGIINAFAGTGVAGFAGDNGPALSAQFNGSWAASMDGQGNVYVGDAQNLRIRKITIPYTLPTVNTTITQTIYGTLSADVNDNSFHRIVTITPTGGVNALAGSVVFGLSFDPSIQLFNGHPYAMRHYDVTPSTNASTSQATVMLYFTQADFNAYNSYLSANSLALPTLPVSATDLGAYGNITILQFHGTGTAPANYTGGAEMITPSVHFNAVNNWWEISFPVNGFSGFFLTSGIVPLPLHLLSFSGLLQGGNVTLDWKTADETGTKLFSVERSSNAKDFVSIGQVAAKDVAGVNSYQYVDQSVAAGAWYYRLRMQDIDGKYTYSSVVSVNVGAAFQGMLVYPNPVADRLFVQLQSTQVEKTVVRLVDMQGKTLQQQEVTLSNGVTSFTFDTRMLAKGTYFISVAGSRPQIRQFVKP